MEFLTVREVATMLKVSPSLIYSLVASGKITSHRVGKGRGAIRIRRDDLDHFLRLRREEVDRPPLPVFRPVLKHLRWR